MDGEASHNLAPLVRTVTTNTVASTATGSSSSSVRTVRASRYQAFHSSTTDPSDFFYPSHQYAYPGQFAPTPPARSSSLRPMPGSHLAPAHLAHLAPAPAPPGVHVQVTHATPTKTGERAPGSAQPPSPTPQSAPAPPPSRGRSRSIDEMTGSDDQRKRTAEEKKLIAREKGKMRQRRKRARDRAAREESQAEQPLPMPIPQAELTTSTLLTIPHRGSTAFPLPPTGPSPPPINTQLYAYSPNISYTPSSISSESSPYWSPAAPSGDLSAHSSTASLVDPTHLAPSHHAPSRHAPSHHVPLSAPIVARSPPGSNAKRRKSEPEPEEFRQIKPSQVGLGFGDDLDVDRPNVRRTASDGGAIPNLPSTPLQPSSLAPANQAEVFASNMVAAVSMNPQLMALLEQSLGVNREDLEEMRGGLAGVFDQWRVNKGMGSVRLDEPVVSGQLECPRSPQYALPPSSATSASASSVGSPDPLYRRPVPLAFPNTFHDPAHQRHVSSSSSGDLRIIPPSLSLQDVTADSSWTGTPIKASGEGAHASPSVSVHTPSTGHGSIASVSTGGYSVSDRSERMQAPFYPMYQNVEMDTTNRSWDEAQGALESPMVVEQEGLQHASLSPSHRLSAQMHSTGMPYPSSAFPSVLQPSPTASAPGGAGRVDQGERPGTAYSMEGYVSGPDGVYYAPNAGNGSMYGFESYRRAE